MSDDANSAVAEAPQIEVSEKGPLLVKNLQKLHNSKGEEIASKKVMALCRCGASSNKPFCDGTHKEIGFSGEKESDGSTDKRDEYVGKSVTIYDNRSICAHAAACTENLAAAFRYKQEPWIDPDAADVEAIVKAVNACPSGALSVSIGGSADAQATEPGITIAKDGPYCVEGKVELSGQGGAEGADTGRYALCRCGRSKNKPFCDGSHWDGFKDEDN